MLATQAQGFKSLMCYGQAMVLTTAIQMDAVVEFYYHSGVVSEILGTVRLGRCWLLSPPDRKISSVDSLSVVVSEMFKTREAMPALTQALQDKVRLVSSAE